MISIQKLEQLLRKYAAILSSTGHADSPCVPTGAEIMNISITQKDVPRIMKFKKPKIRKVEERGFYRGVIAGLLIAVIVAIAWLSLVAIT